MLYIDIDNYFKHSIHLQFVSNNKKEDLTKIVNMMSLYYCIHVPIMTKALQLSKVLCYLFFFFLQ